MIRESRSHGLLVFEFGIVCLTKNIKPNIALIGGYRVLDVNYDKNNFLYDMNQRGPIMGLGFRF